MSSRSVNYYHNTNSINTVIVTIETNKFIFFCRPKWTSQHTDYWKLTNPVYALNWNTRINLTRAGNLCMYCTIILLYSPHFLFCPEKKGKKWEKKKKNRERRILFPWGILPGLKGVLREDTNWPETWNISVCRLHMVVYSQKWAASTFWYP